jgi:glycine/serine hydroxymethyltransferase
MGPEEMRQVARFLARALESRDDEPAVAALAEEVVEFASAFPVPGITDRAAVSA